MKSNRHEQSKHVTVASNLERILRHGYLFGVPSSTEALVGNPPLVSHALKPSMQEVAALIPREVGEDCSYDMAEGTVSDERRASRIRTFQSHSSAGLRESVHKQISIIPALMEGTCLLLFGGTRRATESSRTQRQYW